MVPIALIVLAYLLGSIASAIVVSRLLGRPDPRAGGSGNPGATNVLRLGGKKAAVLTLAGDVLKGVLPVIAARALEQPPELIGAVAFAAFLGHLYPVFFRFRGGKGVATALGGLAAVSLALGAAVLATWLLVAAATRYSSLSALVSALAAPFYAVWLTGEPAYAAAAALIAVFLIWRHRDNIRRLRTGQESRIGGRRGAPDASAG